MCLVGKESKASSHVPGMQQNIQGNLNFFDVNSN